MTGISAYQSMRAPLSKWRRMARGAILDVLRDLKPGQPVLAVIALVDAAYPFGERAMHPYKAWLAERKLLVAALAPPLSPPTHEDAMACEVAADALEQGDVARAQKLLDEQAPRRLNRACPACGAKVGKPCRDAGDQEMTLELAVAYGETIGRRRAIDRIVPHMARVVSREIDSGPLFGGAT